MSAVLGAARRRPLEVASHSVHSGSAEWDVAPSHRRWRRFWTGWLITFLVSGVAGDVLAYVRDGYPASLTGSIRRLTGQEPRTRFGRLKQVALIGFLAWATVHLGWGVLGPSRGRRDDAS